MHHNAIYPSVCAKFQLLNFLLFKGKIEREQSIAGYEITETTWSNEQYVSMHVNIAYIMAYAWLDRFLGLET